MPVVSQAVFRAAQGQANWEMLPGSSGPSRMDCGEGDALRHIGFLGQPLLVGRLDAEVRRAEIRRRRDIIERPHGVFRLIRKSGSQGYEFVRCHAQVLRRRPPDKRPWEDSPAGRDRAGESRAVRFRKARARPSAHQTPDRAGCVKRDRVRKIRMPHQDDPESGRGILPIASVCTKTEDALA